MKFAIELASIENFQKEPTTIINWMSRLSNQCFSMNSSFLAKSLSSTISIFPFFSAESLLCYEMFAQASTLVVFVGNCDSMNDD